MYTYVILLQGPSLQTDQKVSKCSLDPVTQELVKLIFDNDMFRETMQRFDIDVKKMPLGKLSKTQIAKVGTFYFFQTIFF